MTFRQISDPKGDVFEEKDFRSVLRKSFGVVGTRFDAVATMALMLIGTLIISLSAGWLNNIADASKTYKLIQAWAVIGATFSSAVLGFLIAGFSIFATVTKPEIFHHLASVRKENRAISEFKFIFFNFLYVFIWYFAFSALTIATAMLAVEHSPVWYVGIFFHKHSPLATNVLAAEFALILSCLTLYILLILRGFIWNLYQSLLISIFADFGRR